MADHLRVRASRAHRFRGIEDLPGFQVHHPNRPIRGDDDDPVVEVGEQRLKAGFPRIQLSDRVGEVRRHPVHRVRHVFELVARPYLDAPGEIAAAHLLRRRLHLPQGTCDPPRHEGGAPEDQEEREEAGSPDDPRDLPETAVQGRDGDRGAGRPQDGSPDRDREGRVPLLLPNGDASTVGYPRHPRQRVADLGMGGMVFHPGDAGGPHGGIGDHGSVAPDDGDARADLPPEPVPFPGDPLPIRGRIGEQGAERLRDDVRTGEQVLVRVRHHETAHEKEADGAGDEKSDPRGHEVREEEFRGDGEAAGQAASAFPQLVADVLDRLDGLDQEGDLPAQFRDVDVDRAVDHVGVLPPDLR